jgi:hypothetical protein
VRVTDHEGTAHVRADDAIEVVERVLGDGPEDHDARRVDDDVDATEGPLRRLEGGEHLALIGDVSPDRDSAATGSLGVRDDGIRPRFVSRIVHGHREAVADQALDDRLADPAGSARHQGDSCRGCVAHCELPVSL